MAQDLRDFIWSLAGTILRDDVARGKHSDFILPFTVLRRLDCVLDSTKDKVAAEFAKARERGLKRPTDSALHKATGVAFYNDSALTFARLVEHPRDIQDNLKAYVAGFSPNIREIFTKDVGFDLSGAIETLERKDLLYMFVQAFAEIDLHPGAVSNHEMGSIFEYLIRRFNEARNENPGEHFTPRDAIRLIVGLVINGDAKLLSKSGTRRSAYDPACGTAGMLSEMKDYILAEINEEAEIRLYGQEINPETFAIARSDLLMRGDAKGAGNIRPGSTLSVDAHPDERFDYILSNPPYGKPWQKDERAVRAEAERGAEGRFPAGVPREGDSQMLFIQHIMAKLELPGEGGGRAAVITSGTALSTGDAASGDSAIRRWLLENDYVDAVVALPEQIFFNTGIPTFAWILSNRKHEARRGLVQVIDATGVWTPMNPSLGSKRRQFSNAQVRELKETYDRFEESPISRIVPTTEFAFRQITVERPLRLAFRVTQAAVERLEASAPFMRLKDAARAGLSAAAGAMVDGREHLSREEFVAELVRVHGELGHPAPNATVRKLACQHFGLRDPRAEPCLDRGNPEPDPELRTYEDVPFHEDIDAFFEREVAAYVPEAWINRNVVDASDRMVGRVGYSITPSRLFPRPPSTRPLAGVGADVSKVAEAVARLQDGVRASVFEVAGSLGMPVPMRAAAVGWAEEIPAGWSLERLGNMTRMLGGHTPPTNVDAYWVGDMPWISPKDMKRDLIAEGTEWVSERALAETAVTRIPARSVLVVVRGMILAHTFPVALATRDVTMNQDMKAFVTDGRCLPEYLWLFLKGVSPFLLSKVEQAAHGTRTLDTSVLKSLKVAFPADVDEQRAIVEEVRRRTKLLSCAIASLDEQLRLLKEASGSLALAAITAGVAPPVTGRKLRIA